MWHQIYSRIRANTELRIFLLEAYTVIYSFTAAGFNTDKPSLVDDPFAVFRIAIPTALVLAVLLARNAWTGDEERSQLASTVDVSLSFGIAVLSQMALWACCSTLVLPRWRPTQGAWAAWLFLTELRTLFPPQSKRLRQSLPMPGFPMYLEEIRWRAEELERAILQWEKWLVMIAVVALSGSGVSLILNAGTGKRVGSLLIGGGAVYALSRVLLKSGPHTAPHVESFEAYRVFCRTRLDRHCLLLRRIRYAFLLSAIPGLLMLLAGSAVYAYVVLLHVLLAAELLYRATVRLQQELDEVTLATAA